MSSSLAAYTLEVTASKELAAFDVMHTYSLEDIIKIGDEVIPDKMEQIRTKNGTIPEQVSRLFDLIGIDLLIEVNGTRFGIDLTTAVSKHISTKVNKIKTIEPFFEAIDATPLVLRVSPTAVGKITREGLLTCLRRLELKRGIPYVDYNRAIKGR